jgi:hypothetical protein
MLEASWNLPDPGKKLLPHPEDSEWGRMMVQIRPLDRDQDQVGFWDLLGKMVYK